MEGADVELEVGVVVGLWSTVGVDTVESGALMCGACV
jgi:hypothetical protein